MLDNNVSSLDDYRQRLRSTLDAQRTAAYQQPAQEDMAGAGPNDPNAPLDQNSNGFGGGGGLDEAAQQQAPTAQPQAAPQNAQAAGGLSAVGKTGKPPPKLIFKEDKLPEVKGPADLVDAATPKSLNTYMNWYDREVANINQTYDNMHTKLGIKPDEERKMTRKEKFGMLMQFGLNLIKASQGRQYDPLGALAVGVGSTIEDQQAQRKQEGLDYDSKSSMIEGQRQGRLKELGTYGSAMKSQAEINMRGAQQTAENAKLANEEGKAPSTLYTDQGIQSWNKNTKKFEPLTDLNGKPLTNMKVGSRGGVGRDMRPAQQKLFEFLVNERKMDPDKAEQLVFHEKTGDPRKDYISVYSRSLTANFGDSKKADEDARKIIDMLYGEGTDIAGSSPPALTPPKQPNDPLGIRNRK